MSFIGFILQYRWVIIFYLLIAILIYVNRKKWQVESKFILLYKSQFGVNWINKFADKNKKLVQFFGYVGIGIAFIGMIFISYIIIKGLYELIFVPSAPPTMSLVIPGIQVPGSPIFIPFWYGIIALFMVIAFHEFGHGIVARANGIKIKSTGLVFFGPLPGAFVEPDEKTLVKKDVHIQNSIFAAGPFFNVILAAVIALLLFFVFHPLANPDATFSISGSAPNYPTMVYPNGFSFSGIQQGMPAEKYGLEKDVVYNRLNGVYINDSIALLNMLATISPNESINISNDQKSIILITGINPTDPKRGYLGVTGLNTHYEVKVDTFAYRTLYELIYILGTLFEWVFMLSLGIGLANLLPLGPVDGGRMLNITAIDIAGKDKGTKFWARISIFVLIAIIILVFVPIIKGIIFKM